MKIGDKVVRTGNNFCDVFYGDHYRVRDIS